MNSLNRNSLVEVDRRKVVSMGGTLYVGVPDHLKRQGVEAGDEIIYLRSAEFEETVIGVLKKTAQGGSSDEPGKSE